MEVSKMRKESNGFEPMAVPSEYSIEAVSDGILQLMKRQQFPIRFSVLDSILD